MKANTKFPGRQTCLNLKKSSYIGIIRRGDGVLIIFSRVQTKTGLKFSGIIKKKKGQNFNIFYFTCYMFFSDIYYKTFEFLIRAEYFLNFSRGFNTFSKKTSTLKNVILPPTSLRLNSTVINREHVK